MHRVLGLIILLASSTSLSAAAPAKQGAPAGTLQLLKTEAPAAPATIENLAKSSWVSAGMKNILGAGIDQILTFKTDDKNQLTLEVTRKTFYSVNKKQPVDESKEAFSCTISEYIVRYGDQQQTYFLLPNKELVLNALVPQGQGKWYYASRLVQGKAQFRDEELLFDFTDDPTQHDSGAGTLQIRSGDAGKPVTKKITFTLQHKDKTGRVIDVIADDQNKSHWAKIFFPSSGQYGQMLDQIDQNSKIFTAGNP